MQENTHISCIHDHPSKLRSVLKLDKKVRICKKLSDNFLHWGGPMSTSQGHSLEVIRQLDAVDVGLRISEGQAGYGRRSGALRSLGVVVPVRNISTHADERHTVQLPVVLAALLFRCRDIHHAHRNQVPFPIV